MADEFTARRVWNSLSLPRCHHHHPGIRKLMRTDDDDRPRRRRSPQYQQEEVGLEISSCECGRRRRGSNDRTVRPSGGLRRPPPRRIEVIKIGSLAHIVILRRWCPFLLLLPRSESPSECPFLLSLRPRRRRRTTTATEAQRTSTSHQHGADGGPRTDRPTAVCDTPRTRMWGEWEAEAEKDSPRAAVRGGQRHSLGRLDGR